MLTSLQRLLVLRCMRPDKCVPAISAFVAAELGREFIEPPPFNLADCYADSSNVAPLIIILSPGQDPKNEVLKVIPHRC